MAASIVKFWHELKRRKVIRVAVAYAIVAWIVIEVSSVLLPTLMLPDWSLRLVTVLAILGLPVALVLAWVFELTPSGAKLDTTVSDVNSGLHASLADNSMAVLEIPSSSAADDRRSIVVLPFANLSDEAAQAFFSDGITEEILALLAKQPDLRVVSRTTSFTFKDSKLDIRAIAEKLNVEMVLEGSVRRAGNQVRIMAQLIDPARDAQLWSDRFDRELTDIFAVQGEIARHIVDALSLDPDCCPVVPAPTQEIEAWDYYLRGRQYFYTMSESSIDIARKMFQQAIEIDPMFARAHAGLANVESVTAQWFDHSPAAIEAADAASLKALKLSPNLAEAHSSRGYALTLKNDFSNATLEFERALEIEPANYDTLYLFGRSRFAEGKMAQAADLFRQAHEAQPDEFQAIALQSASLQALGTDNQQHEVQLAAIRAIRQRVELNPDDMRALSLGCTVLVNTGQIDEGLEMARRLLELAPNDPSALYNATCAFAKAGRHDEALDLLERRASMGGLYREWVEKDADFNSVREHPRFQALLERMSSPRKRG